MKYDLLIFRQAQQELDQIISFIFEKNKMAALKIAEKIERKFDSLLKQPFMGSLPRDSDIASLGFRFVTVKPYLIFYQIENQTVEIHHILHSARDYHYILL